MKYFLSLLLTLALLTPSLRAGNDFSDFKSDNTLPGLQWFPDAKFGIFIHMTLQNVPMTQEESKEYKGNPEKSREIASRLDLSKYDAKQQARMFKEWGAKYVVLTTKHHVGFFLADGPGDFNVMNSSNVKRDIVREYVDALREEGMKVGLYFSLPDWTHPDYASVANEKLPKEERVATRAYSVETDTARWNRFVDDMFEQVRFLCTNYGKIDLLWFDGDWERSAEQWRSKELAAMISELQPECVVNNRLRHPDLGHYATPEYNIPTGQKKGWWENCITSSDYWDGDLSGTHIKPPEDLIRVFSDIVGMGGNMLLNVSPLDKGAITVNQTDTIGVMGKWIRDHEEAIFGTTTDFPAELYDGPVTRRGKTLYLFCHDIPKHGLVLKGTNKNVKRASLLASDKEIDWHYTGGYASDKQRWLLHIGLKPEDVEEYTTIVKLEFNDDEDVEFRNSSGKPFKL